MLKVYPENGWYLAYNKVEMPWPISDRGLLLFAKSPVNVDWYGKKAFFIFFKQGWHPSKSENTAGDVMVTNGGNFYVVTPDEKNPETACTVFGMAHNNLNGWIPKWNMEWFSAMFVPPKLNLKYENLKKLPEQYFEELRE